MSERTVRLEIAVTSAEGVRIARANGADRVELCAGLELGGITPSQGLVETAIAASDGLPIHALVRCRPGDFRYSAEELATMLAEVRTLVAAGVAGVVVGALDENGGVDSDTVARFVEAAREVNPDAGVTLHRVIDQAANPIEALGTLRARGVDRVLTSGQAATAGAGIPVLRRMVGADTGLEIMAGGGVTVGDIPLLVAEAGVHAVHFSAKKRAETAEPANWIPLGSAGTSAEDDGYFVTDAATVAEAAGAVDALA